jgi:hypothetical protein
MKVLAVLALALAATAATATGVDPAIPARSGPATSPRRLGTPASTAAIDCPRGTTRARIGGRQRCLRVGQRCDPHFNTTRPSYRRYGFLCASRASNEPTTLFRIAQPGAAPSTCPGIGPTPTSTPPGIQGTWVGASPFWLGPYLKRDPNLSVWRYATNLPLKGNDGWAVKFIWLVARTVTGPVRVSIANLATERLLSITIGGSYTDRSTAPLLDPARPSHPDVPDKPDTHEWGSYVVFPRAGCYRLDTQWPQGSWSLVFSFGR